MKKLVIAVGSYGAGKTTFAKWYAKEHNGVYLDFELLYFDGNEGNSFDVFPKRLASVMEKSTSELFVMDGLDESIHLKDNIECEVQVCLCFAAPHIIYTRQQCKALHVACELPDSEEVIKLAIYHRFNMITMNGAKPLFVDTTDGFHFVTKEEFPQHWEELIFCSNLLKMSHDKYYGDIELPSGVMIPGYTKSYKTWDRLKHLVNFQDKSVLDLGCFHGYFSFKAEEAGARSVVGIDASEETIEVVKQLAVLRKSRAHFRLGNINDFEAHCVYDVVLVLNVLHHIKNVDHALVNMFRSGKLIVFETPTSQKSIISAYAKQFGFVPAGRANSHREGREISLFSWASTFSARQIPTKFQYNYKAARLRKLPREVVASLVWELEPYFPFGWLMRRYRSIRESRTKRLTYR